MHCLSVVVCADHADPATQQRAGASRAHRPHTVNTWSRRQSAVRSPAVDTAQSG